MSFVLAGQLCAHDWHVSAALALVLRGSPDMRRWAVVTAGLASGNGFA